MATSPVIMEKDLPENTSNLLYTDHEHFQTIFSNDSRFFDTSLHLFVSYRDLGYIRADYDPSQTHASYMPTSTEVSDSRRQRWKARILHLANGTSSKSAALKSFLTPSLPRRSSHSSYYDPNAPTNYDNDNARNNWRHSSFFIRRRQPSAASSADYNAETFEESDVVTTKL